MLGDGWETEEKRLKLAAFGCLAFALISAAFIPGAISKIEPDERATVVPIATVVALGIFLATFASARNPSGKYDTPGHRLGGFVLFLVLFFGYRALRDSALVDVLWEFGGSGLFAGVAAGAFVRLKREQGPARGQAD